MAKKSARSKGYRKYHKETKGYTPQEKKTMIIGFAVIAIVLICVLWLPDFIESFHLLKVKDGVVQDVGDNWLIANVGTSSNKKYRKLAEFDGVEGYELASTENGITDTNLRYFVYEPTSEDAPAQTVNVQSGNGEAAKLAENYLTQMAAFGEVLNQSESVIEGEVNGMKTYAVVMEYRSENYEAALEKAEAEADAEATEETAEAAEETAEAAEETAEAAEETAEATEETAEAAEETAEATEETAEAAEETAEATEETAEAAEETEEEVVYDYCQMVVLYIDSNLTDKCVVLNAMNSGSDETSFRDSDAMLELLQSAAASITLAN